MKNALFFAVLTLFAVSSFAQSIPNDFLFIEGTAENEEHREFFLTNFAIEAATFGYTVTKTKQEAAYTFRFSVIPNTVMIDGVQRPAPPNDNQYILRIYLINNKDNMVVLRFDFFFTQLIEMYEYTQLIFLKATVYIPPAARSGGADRTVKTEDDRGWQNKWIYLRASVNYPVVFHVLKPTGLVGGQAVYDGTFDAPVDMIPLEHKIQPQPGATIGIEFQFLNFMSLEANFQVSMGDTSTYSYYNTAAGAELKFPIKTPFLIFEPYLAANYLLNPSPLFTEFPSLSFGAGIQIAAKGGKHGTFFVDINYLHSFTDAVMKNPYDPLAPNPEVLHYNRFVMGLGVGYKFGFFNKKKN